MKKFMQIALASFAVMTLVFAGCNAKKAPMESEEAAAEPAAEEAAAEPAAEEAAAEPAAVEAEVEATAETSAQ